MVVSISIMALVTSLFIANYRTGSRRSDLIMTAQGLVADLHLAQNHSLGLVKYNGEVPGGGWGINLVDDAQSYTLFADLNKPGTAGYMGYNALAEGVPSYGARVTTLPDGIVIDNLQTGASTANSAVNVTFLPPDPQTNIYRVGPAATSTSLEIRLRELRSNTTKTVRVNFLGLVEVID